MKNIFSQIRFPMKRKTDSRAARGYHAYRGEKRPVRCLTWLCLAVLFFLLERGIWLTAGHFPAAGAFLRRIGQAVSAWLSRLCGILPVPVNEWLIGLALALLLFLFVRTLIRRDRAALGRGVCCLLALVSLCNFLFMASYKVQHTAPSLASRLGLEVREYSPEELETFVLYAAQQCCELAEQVPRDADGTCDFGDFRPISEKIHREYAVLAEVYPVFDTVRPAPVKQSFLGGRIMSRVNLSGYFFPWTGECIVSTDTVQSHIPFDIAHEEAHALGIGPEAECNYCAWLLCQGSEDVRFRYSGWLNAFIYADNAYYALGKSIGKDRLSPAVRHDLQVLSEMVHRFDGPLNDAGTAVNDAFIKSTGQSDGIRSYGRAVDLLLAHFYSYMQE